MKSYGINGFKTGQEVKEIHKVGEVSVIRSIKSIGKVKQNILYAKSIRIQTLALLKEIPNMKIKVTPKIKDRKPILKLEIEGNSIYANAIIEIK